MTCDLPAWEVGGMPTRYWLAVVALTAMTFAFAALLTGPHVAWKGADLLAAATVAAALFQAAFAGVALFGLRHANSQAQAARDALDETRESNLRIQQPYVAVDGVHIERCMGGERDRILVNLKNWGATPATGMQVYTAVHVAPMAVFEHMERGAPYFGSNASMTLYPGENHGIVLTATEETTQARAEQVWAGALRIHVRVDVTYDAIGRPKVVTRYFFTDGQRDEADKLQVWSHSDLAVGP